MGNNQNKPGARNDGGASEPKLQSVQPVAKKTELPPPVPILQPADIVISATQGDEALVAIFKTKIQSAGYSVFSNTSTTDEAAKTVGKLVVDAKTFIFVVSEESGSNNKCSDQVSLAYISNKPIVIAARKSKKELMPKMNLGLKLTLANIQWTVFESDTPDDALVNQFVQLVQQYESPVNETVEAVVEQPLEAAPPFQNKRMRINTKLRSGTTVTDSEVATDTFWERNFGDDEEIAWFRFEKEFLTEYDAQLQGLFTDEHIPWLLEMMRDDIFGGCEKVSRSHFQQVRGDSTEKHSFYCVVSQIAVEKFNMKEVFNMKSTVRLTAVENLGKFQNLAVIEALLRLLEDADPNIRAVAAISLGRTGVQEESIIDTLISMLKDGDRIVRQSVCLSLGALKATKAIPHISNIWRNDFISVVRDAARTALEKMEVPEAQEVLKVTRILEDEIKQLEGKIVQV